MRIADFPLVNDVRDEYASLRRDGLDCTAATKELLLRYNAELTIGVADDAHLFWVGLADAQCAFGELSCEVAENALAAIRHMENEIPGISQRGIQNREQKYSDYPMPENKRIKKSRKFRCSWNVGDTFAHRLAGPEADALGLVGKYAIIRKVDDVEFGDGRLLPVVALSLWSDPQLPQSSADLSKVRVMALARGRLNTSHTKFEYRTQILFRSKKQLDGLGLEYLGNFIDVQMPANEIVFRQPVEISMMTPEYFDRDFCNYWKVDNHFANCLD